jgi:flagellar biosynthesis/type III secretory pathway chaperone
MTTTKLTPEELSSLTTLQQNRIQLIEQFGIMEWKLQELEFQKSNLVSQLHKLRQEETTIGGKLQQKYGDGSINLEKGEFIGS